jgi:hypothetical protein
MVNIWALQKHESIKLLLLLLTEKLGPESFIIAENQDLDERAMRLAKVDDPSITAYLYTYGQEEGRYGVHLELPERDDVEISNTLEIYERLTIERLVNTLLAHFDIAPKKIDVDSVDA